MVIPVSCVKLFSPHNSPHYSNRKHKLLKPGVPNGVSYTQINFVCPPWPLFPSGKPVLPPALYKSAPTLGEKGVFAYWGAFSPFSPLLNPLALRVLPDRGERGFHPPSKKRVIYVYPPKKLGGKNPKKKKNFGNQNWPTLKRCP
eukprot:FR739347.1.p1 GENE.FR739347.1~~FR739347.1.p1  ORF type:complete len:144 (+),score=20.67 FR739347.1:700-1131(+)